MKDVLTALAARLGFTLIPNWRMPAYQGAEYLRKLFDLLAIDCVLDVGANRGQYHDFLRHQVGYGGQILSFEPNPAVFRELAARPEVGARWSVFPFALGRSIGTMPFHIMADSEFSSFLTPRHDQIGQFRDLNRVTQTIDIEVRTLDQVLDDLQRDGASRSVFMKLDTQGFDLEVLAGAPIGLDSIAALSTEVAIAPIYDGMPDFATVHEFLKRRGFVASGIYPNNEGHFPILVECDLYMLSKRHAPAGGRVPTG